MGSASGSNGMGLLHERDAGVKTADKPTRPALRWHGGKWRLAPWIISHFPEHRIYTEAYGGAGSVLLKKPRAYGEIWNDLDDEAVNLFQVLRDKRLAAELRRALYLTPFSRREFELSYESTTDPTERARRLVIRSYQGFGANAHNRGAPTGFRPGSNRSHTTPAHDWANYPSALARIIKRIRGVVIEHRDALKVLLQHDMTDTLHYVDPPYIHSTRGTGHDAKHRYRYEMFPHDHENLAQILRGLKGMVVLSGYPSPLYDRLFGDWKTSERQAMADGANERTEVLWMNPACVDKLGTKFKPKGAGNGQGKGSV